MHPTERRDYNIVLSGTNGLRRNVGSHTRGKSLAGHDRNERRYEDGSILAVLALSVFMCSDHRILLPVELLRLLPNNRDNSGNESRVGSAECVSLKRPVANSNITRKLTFLQ